MLSQFLLAEDGLARLRCVDTIEVAIANEALDFDQLSLLELQKFESLPDHRREAWLVGRQALQKILAKYGNNVVASSLSFPNPRISISHSGQVAVAAIAPTKRSCGLGVDIEQWRSMDLRAAELYMTESELACCLDEKAALQVWTIKEALFKSDPENQDKAVWDYQLNCASDPNGWAQASHHGESMAFFYSSWRTEQGVISIAQSFRRSANGNN